MTNLSTCTDCGGTVSKSASRCPHCGRNWPDADERTKAYALILVPALILLAVAAVLALS